MIRRIQCYITQRFWMLSSGQWLDRISCCLYEDKQPCWVVRGNEEESGHQRVQLWWEYLLFSDYPCALLISQLPCYQVELHKYWGHWKQIWAVSLLAEAFTDWHVSLLFFLFPYQGCYGGKDIKQAPESRPGGGLLWRITLGLPWWSSD